MKNTVNKSHMGAEKVVTIFDDYTLGVEPGNTHYIFPHTRGELGLLSKNGREWLYRETLPAFWRATTDNDRGSGFGFRSGVRLGAGLYPKVKEIGVLVDGKEIDLPITLVSNQCSGNEYAETIEIVFTLEISTVPKTQVTISYQIAGEGKMLVNVHYYEQKELPELSALGLRFIMPTEAKFFEYESLSRETYPGRTAGGVRGIYRVAGLPISPYLVPQECGMYMETRWVELTRNQTLDNTDKDQGDFSLRFGQQDTPFVSSALPSKAEKLEQVTHIEELPPERRTVLTIFAEVKRVGGINSWGADVESPYQISSEEDHGIGFIIQ